MAAPVLLRVSVPRWERVARYAVCAAGILLSIYAYHVEREKERDPEHRALCDLGPWVKCSAALTSRYPDRGSGPGTAKGSEGGGWGWGARGGSSGLEVDEEPAAEGPTAVRGGLDVGQRSLPRLRAPAQDQAAGAEMVGLRDLCGEMRWHSAVGRPERTGSS